MWTRAYFIAITTLMTLQAAVSAAPISLQGRLVGVPDGAQQITVNIWDAETDGNLVASETVQADVFQGIFSLTVDLPFATFDAAERWWSAEIGGVSTPRLLVASVPKAMVASRIGTGAPISVSSIEVRSLSPQPRAYIDMTHAPIDRDFDYRLAVQNPGDPYFVLNSDITEQGLIMRRNGRIGIGTNNPTDTLDVRGTTRTRVLTITGGSDLAEPFAASPVQKIAPKPGMVLSIDPEHAGALRVSTQGYDTKVAGVYSGGNGLPTGLLMGKDGCELTSDGQDRLPLAMTGRVWVYADESNGTILPGGRLTTSGKKPGHAMRVTDNARSVGAVIGKAMTGVDPETGMVLVLVNLQ